MLTSVVRSRWFVTGFAVLLIGGGLLAVVQGVGVFRQSVAEPNITPWPTRAEERLIPSPTASWTATIEPSPNPTEAPTSPLEPSETPVPTLSAQALIPTSTPGATKSPTVLVASSAPSVMPTATPYPVPSATPLAGPGLFSPRQRVGIILHQRDIERYDAAQLGAAWYVTGSMAQIPPGPPGMEFVQMLPVAGASLRTDAATLQQIARSNPGALWLAGNEPDVIWQSNATPREYAQVYHDVYHLLKEADPTAQVAIGGVSQVTPLRLRYLEELLAVYQEAYGKPMPVDVWNIHLAILREERGAWGVDIPPGMPEDTGILYEIEDNADIEILKEQVRTFRSWMKEQGQRNKPLIVSEFSVLMPPEYGFPFETVRDYMYDAFDFLLAATDDETGFPADGNRLVQRFAWYSVADEVYYNGNLFDPKTAQITSLGEAFVAYTSGLAP